MQRATQRPSNPSSCGTGMRMGGLTMHTRMEVRFSQFILSMPFWSNPLIVESVKAVANVPA